MTPKRFTLLASALLVVLAASPSAAQVFGKNKVQYEPLDWSVLETPHLRLHYYAEEESLARHLVVYAESVCVEYDGRFRLPQRAPVPFLLYSVHHLFQQTNATPGFISEGTGGLTELVKGRVLLPHNGSWARLRWVTRHELTHSYMLEKLAHVMRDHRRNQSYLPPLWFIEGLAEFCGTTWDADAEGLLRDAVVSGEALPLTRSEPILGTVLMYKEGQSFLLYLADQYGEARIFDLLDNWWRADDFETLFRITYGRTLAEVDDAWFASVRRRYYPVVSQASAAPDVATRLTHGGDFNLGPRVLPGRSPADTALRFCYFAAGEGGIDLMVSEPRKGGGRRETRLLRGGQTPAFESFHLFQNRPDASPSGKIVLSSKRGGRDAIYVLDSKNGRVLRRLEFRGLVAINDPVLAPDDQSIVFSAQDYGGRSDLYRASWPDKKVTLERMTRDDFDDIEPDVSPDGKWAVFASDRGDRAGHYSLFRIPLAGGPIEKLSDPATGDDRQPVYSPDGKWIAYRSTRTGTSDLWVRSSEPSLEARRVTSLLGPAYDPDWTANSRGLLFMGQNAVRFQVYRIPVDPDSLVAEAEVPAPPAPVLPTASTDEEASRYQRRIGFDLVQNAIAVDPGAGGVGAGQIALSDLLGNEQYYIFLANDSERFGDFWDGFQVGVTYLNRAHRLNWGVGLFRLTEMYDVDLDLVRREKRIGLQGLVSYPFSKFTRIDASILVRRADDHRLRNGRIMDADLVSNYLTLVHDNTRWTMMGPSYGIRTSVTGGFTRDLTGGAGDFSTFQAELRHYMMPVSHIVLANRIQSQLSGGPDAQRFYLGGWSSIRGYDRRALSGVQTALLQTELRFPLLRGLMMAFPSRWLFPSVGGAVFADAAWSWRERQRPQDFLLNYFGYGQPDHLGSVGAGFFVGGGFFPAMRWDYVWVTPNYRDFPVRPRTKFSFFFNF